MQLFQHVASVAEMWIETHPATAALNAFFVYSVELVDDAVG